MHFSLAVSRLSDQSKVLAQRLAMLEERVRENESGQARAEGDTAADEPESAPGPEGSSGLLRSRL